jgi:sigma-54 dependent transcriptional regulator, acetoin dehydrogenase operon transcriptional activator AcoR
MFSAAPKVSAGLPLQPFFGSAEQRAALARERFFEQGQRPTGLVSEAVLQSWGRCRSARRNPGWGLAFDPVSRSRLQATLEQNRALLLAAGDEISRLESALAGTSSRVLLTDHNGVIVHATGAEAGGDGATPGLLTRVARRGVSLAEDVVGTNAPAVVLKTGEAVTVLGSEHYFDCVHSLRCAAAPIHDGQGRLAGVLDLTVEARPFAFDAAALVGVYATVIENRLLQAQASEHLVAAFQVCPTMLGTPLQALVGIDGHGVVAWRNAVAHKLLGLAGAEAPTAEQVLGLPLAGLVSRSAGGAPLPLHLPNGLLVWLQVQLRSHDAPRARLLPGAQPAAPPAVPQPAAAPTLDALARDAIERTVAECGGNLSAAARRLGVSRGLLYRRRGAARA